MRCQIRVTLFNHLDYNQNHLVLRKVFSIEPNFRFYLFVIFEHKVLKSN
jgi:hypothetical protein